jgi:hypothetical protein
MPRIFRLLLAASGIIAGGIWFTHWSHTRALNGGQVHVRTTPEAPGLANQPTSEVATNQPDASVSGQQGEVATIPTTQPITRNPQSALMPVSTGKFQLYRQGDITYRINAQTGTACVLFATQAQWSKALVYQNGCGAR